MVVFSNNTWPSNRSTELQVQTLTNHEPEFPRRAQRSGRSIVLRSRSQFGYETKSRPLVSGLGTINLVHSAELLQELKKSLRKIHHGTQE